MHTTRWLRLTALSLTPVITFAGLALAALRDPGPDAKAVKKASTHSLALFAQATKDDFLGDKECVACHKAQADSFEQSPHAAFSRNPHRSIDRQGCESCHGPGKIHLAHMDDEKDIPKYIIGYTRGNPRDTSAACLRCHQDTLSDAHWRRTGHARANVGCTDCHQIHKSESTGVGSLRADAAANRLRQPFFVAAPDPHKLLKGDETVTCGRCHQKEIGEFRHNFHHPIPEGRMVCSDCHQVHPTKAGRRMMRPGKQFCVTCHANVVGPFAFAHEIQVGTEDSSCTECHRPHGSPNPKLLTLFSRGLCNQCHSDKANNHFPGRSCWQAGCHVGVHGSHTDPLLLRR